MLKTVFINLVNKYTDEPEIALSLWAEIEKHYTGTKRYYHNLQHLQNMYMHLESCREQISDWDTILFSLFYHDIIYKVTAKDNEEKSALAAIKNLELLHYSKEKIKACGEMIIATKSHEINTDSDTNIFTDVDLSILGSSSEAYKEYTNQVRQEYSIFPDFMYYPGRKKVLEHFLKMETIFKTHFFKEKFEDQAKRNISAELSLLS